jgi:hypothetical protein
VGPVESPRMHVNVDSHHPQAASASHSAQVGRRAHASVHEGPSPRQSAQAPTAGPPLSPETQELVVSHQPQPTNPWQS